MATGKQYLDYAGLQKFWELAKKYFNTRISTETADLSELADRVQAVKVVYGGNEEQIISIVDGDMTQKTGDVVTIDMSAFAKKADYTSYMEFKGTKTADQMIALVEAFAEDSSLIRRGDVYLITGDGSSAYVSGSEYVWDGSKFEAIGPGFDLTGYYTKENVDNIIDNYYDKSEMDDLLDGRTSDAEFEDLEATVAANYIALESEPIPEATIRNMFGH